MYAVVEKRGDRKIGVTLHNSINKAIDYGVSMCIKNISYKGDYKVYVTYARKHLLHRKSN
jgi:hypothetical protein